MFASREVTFRARHSHRGMLIEPSHEHEFRVRICMKGAPNEEGFICDFRAVKRIFNRIVGSQLADKDLDTLFQYPTSENLARWIWQKLSPFFPLYSIEVREKPHSSATYFGDEPKS